jgi:hypothetical protein
MLSLLPQIATKTRENTREVKFFLRFSFPPSTFLKPYNFKPPPDGGLAILASFEAKLLFIWLTLKLCLVFFI